MEMCRLCGRGVAAPGATPVCAAHGMALHCPWPRVAARTAAATGGDGGGDGTAAIRMWEALFGPMSPRCAPESEHLSPPPRLCDSCNTEDGAVRAITQQMLASRPCETSLYRKLFRTGRPVILMAGAEGHDASTSSSRGDPAVAELPSACTDGAPDSARRVAEAAARAGARPGYACVCVWPSPSSSSSSEHREPPDAPSWPRYIAAREWRRAGKLIRYARRPRSRTPKAE